MLYGVRRWRIVGSTAAGKGGGRTTTLAGGVLRHNRGDRFSARPRNDQCRSASVSRQPRRSPGRPFPDRVANSLIACESFFLSNWPCSDNALKAAYDRVLRVDLEVPPQRRTRVAASEAVGPQRDVRPRHPRADLIGHEPHVVADGNEGAGEPFQDLLQIALSAAFPSHAGGSTVRRRGASRNNWL